MKRNLFKTLSSVVLTVLFISSCQKESLTVEKDTIVSSDAASKSEHNNQCRLVSLNTNFGFTSSVSYNNRGLANTWSLSYDFGSVVYTMLLEYDANNRLTRAKYINTGDYLYDVVYYYNKKGLVEKEKWYLPNTNILDDEVFFTYNTRGDAVRQQSFIYGVDAHIIPDAKGNYTRYDLYIDGNLVQTGLYTFNRSNKNPWTAMKGIPYGLPGYAFQFSKWWETSETIIFYDEEGNPYYYYDQNPSRTRMRMNDQDYLLEVKHYDRLTGDLYQYSFDYEHCGDRDERVRGDQPAADKLSAWTNKKSKMMKIMSTHGKELRENQLKLRKQVVEMNRNK
ncbi:MAG: hypothetical protein IPP96_05665 [Chitinophagaceae bacterium]|nr:hypothetical protein [Chitinophagaceae bacterium]